MKKAFVKHHSDKEMITVNALMTLEFFCNDKSFHDNGMHYINVGFTSIWSFLKLIGEHQVMQSASPGLWRAACTAEPGE